MQSQDKRFTYRAQFSLFNVWHWLTKLLTISLSIFLFFPIFAANRSSTQKLAHLDKQIKEANSQLQTTQKCTTELTNTLKNIEISVGQLAKNITRIDAKIIPKNTSLLILKKREQQLKQELSSQQRSLTKTVQSAYINHQATYLKFLFNQQNAQQFSRMSHYYQYYSNAHLTFITHIRATLSSLQDTQQKITTQVAILTNLRGHRLREQQQLDRLRQQRQLSLTQLKGHIKTQQQKLAQLVENKRNLEKLLQRLSQQGAVTKTKSVVTLGPLFWPTQGTITSRFGSKQTPQSIPEQGVFISAPLGKAVKAVAAGNIIYADWLKGFGLLIIIDHGQGLMSLYSHCNSLYNQVGDIITAGNIVATTGNSGGFQKTGLMFELRRHGKPFDPALWCKGQP